MVAWTASIIRGWGRESRTIRGTRSIRRQSIVASVTGTNVGSKPTVCLLVTSALIACVCLASRLMGVWTTSFRRWSRESWAIRRTRSTPIQSIVALVAVTAILNPTLLPILLITSRLLACVCQSLCLMIERAQVAPQFIFTIWSKSY